MGEWAWCAASRDERFLGNSRSGCFSLLSRPNLMANGSQTRTALATEYTEIATDSQGTLFGVRKTEKLR